MIASQHLTIKSGKVTARIALRGAELKSLRVAEHEFVWGGAPAWWSYSAPILFPVIGRVTGQSITHQGRMLNLPTHGFARDLVFVVHEFGPAHVELALCASSLTLEMYPFLFELKVRFEIRNNCLHQTARVTNMGAELMPASFGFHPAFNWTPDFSMHAAYSARFTHIESDNNFRIDQDGFLVPSTLTQHFSDLNLKIDATLLGQGTVVFNPVASSGLTFLRQNVPMLKLGWTGCTQLAVWTPSGAPFICFEPWCGLPVPNGFAGELLDRPSGFSLKSEHSREFQMSFAF